MGFRLKLSWNYKKCEISWKSFGINSSFFSDETSPKVVDPMFFKSKSANSHFFSSLKVTVSSEKIQGKNVLKDSGDTYTYKCTYMYDIWRNVKPGRIFNKY